MVSVFLYTSLRFFYRYLPLLKNRYSVDFPSKLYHEIDMHVVGGIHGTVLSMLFKYSACKQSQISLGKGSNPHPASHAHFLFDTTIWLLFYTCQALCSSCCYVLFLTDITHQYGLFYTRRFFKFFLNIGKYLKKYRYLRKFHHHLGIQSSKCIGTSILKKNV